MALCFAILSWAGCYYLFRYPERAANYSLLARLDRLPGHHFFPAKGLPSHQTLNPEDLYRQFDLLALRFKNPERSDVQIIAEINRNLLHRYLTRYAKKNPAIITTGTFRIKAIRELTKSDFISQGYVVLLQALKNTGTPNDPNYEPFPLEIELLLPTASGTTISPDTRIASDNQLELNKTAHAFSLLHLTPGGTPDDPLPRFTAIPLLDSSFALTEGSKLTLSAPKRVNIQAPFPLFPLR